MFHALLALSSNPVTNFTNFLTGTLTAVIPVAIAVLGFMFLLKHKIRDLIVLLLIGGLVYSFVVDPTIFSNLANFFTTQLGI